MATPDYKTTSQRDFCFTKTTSLQDYETTSGAVAGGASPELRNYGITDLWIYGFMDFGFAASDNGLWLRFATPDN